MRKHGMLILPICISVFPSLVRYAECELSRIFPVTGWARKIWKRKNERSTSWPTPPRKAASFAKGGEIWQSRTFWGIYNYCFLSLFKNCLISPSYSGLPISRKRDVRVSNRRVPILRGGILWRALTCSFRSAITVRKSDFRFQNYIPSGYISVRSLAAAK